MSHIVPRHMLRFAYHLTNEHFVLLREFASPGVGHIKTQAVRFREIPARRRVVDLRKIFYSKAPIENGGRKSPRQIDQKKTTIIITEYV